jgi:hypothetical protein
MRAALPRFLRSKSGDKKAVAQSSDFVESPKVERNLDPIQPVTKPQPAGFFYFRNPQAGCLEGPQGHAPGDVSKYPLHMGLNLMSRVPQTGLPDTMQVQSECQDEC